MKQMQILTAYQDRLYINDGKGNFKLDSTALPQNFTSKFCVRAMIMIKMVILIYLLQVGLILELSETCFKFYFAK